MDQSHSRAPRVGSSTEIPRRRRHLPHPPRQCSTPHPAATAALQPCTTRRRLSSLFQRQQPEQIYCSELILLRTTHRFFTPLHCTRTLVSCLSRASCACIHLTRPLRVLASVRGLSSLSSPVHRATQHPAATTWHSSSRRHPLLTAHMIRKAAHSAGQALVSDAS